MPGVLPGTRDTTLNKRDSVSALIELTVYLGRQSKQLIMLLFNYTGGILVHTGEEEHTFLKEHITG